MTGFEVLNLLDQATRLNISTVTADILNDAGVSLSELQPEIAKLLESWLKQSVLDRYYNVEYIDVDEWRDIFKNALLGQPKLQSEARINLHEEKATAAYKRYSEAFGITCGKNYRNPDRQQGVKAEEARRIARLATAWLKTEEELSLLKSQESE